MRRHCTTILSTPFIRFTISHWRWNSASKNTGGVLKTIGIIDERQRAKSSESQRKEDKRSRIVKKGGEEGEKGVKWGKKEIGRAPGWHTTKDIYSQCSPFCSRNHHLCALRCSAFVQRQMCARLLHLAASRIEPVCAVFFNFSLSW